MELLGFLMGVTKLVNIIKIPEKKNHYFPNTGTSKQTCFYQKNGYFLHNHDNTIASKIRHLFPATSLVIRP